MKWLFRVIGYVSLLPLVILFWPLAVVLYMLFYAERGKNYEWNNIELIGIGVLGVVLEVINVAIIMLALFGGVAQ